MSGDRMVRSSGPGVRPRDVCPSVRKFVSRSRSGTVKFLGWPVRPVLGLRGRCPVLYSPVLVLLPSEVLFL